MRLSVALALFVLAVPCHGQDGNKKVDDPPECQPRIQKQGRLLSNSAKFLPYEKYKNSPIVKYEILEDGSVANAKVIRSSGVHGIDREVLNWVAHTKYKPRPGCGILDSEMSVTIDFGP